MRGERLHAACGTVPRRPAVSARTWSPYQESFFDLGTNGHGNVMVMAVAGSGKTTAIQEFCRRLPATLVVKYLVFNKHSADEAVDRMPPNVDTSTFHSACNAALSRRLGRPEVDDAKVAKLLAELVRAGEVDSSEAEVLRSAVLRLVSLAKNEGIDALVDNELERWHELVVHHDIQFDIHDVFRDAESAELRGVELARTLLAASNADTSVIDFDDMLYLTVRLGISLPVYDLVCVDEAQDTNRVQRAILHKMLRLNGGRLVVVGDPRQAIYGFRGAAADAMELIAREFNTVELPLSISYRCSKAVVRAAQQFCPEIEAWSEAPEGEVRDLAFFRATDFKPTDAILSRKNLPLVELAYALLAGGVRCHVLGRDIGEGMIRLVEMMQGHGKKPITIEELEGRLQKYRRRERVRLKDDEARQESLTDRVDSVVAAIDTLPEPERNLNALKAHIRRLFVDDGTGRLTLATVHKAKGLEWDRVFVLNRHSDMPGRGSKPWQQEQENNLIYVAYTRARVELYFVELAAIGFE